MRWEYLVIGVQKIRADCERIFSNYGQEGWELVTVENEAAYFKRPLSIGVYDDEIVNAND